MTCHGREEIDWACVAKVSAYRSCGRKGCKVEIAYCKVHGGDERAMNEMTKHIADVHGDA